MYVVEGYQFVIENNGVFYCTVIWCFHKRRYYIWWEWTAWAYKKENYFCWVTSFKFDIEQVAISVSVLLIITCTAIFERHLWYNCSLDNSSTRLELLKSSGRVQGHVTSRMGDEISGGCLVQPLHETARRTEAASQSSRAVTQQQCTEWGAPLSGSAPIPSQSDLSLPYCT